MKRTLIATAVAASFFATNLLAADAAGPLAPGKPSGVSKAQDLDLTTVAVAGGVVLAGVLIGLSTQQKDKTQAVNTTPAQTSVSTAS
jgi:hypothetical protein